MARSTLNTPRKQRARGGNKRNIVEAGEGSGEEVFIPSRRSFEIRGEMVNEERSGWGGFEKAFLYRDMG